MKNIQVKYGTTGLGIFTEKKLLPEETTFQIKGKLISCDESDVLDETTRSNTFRFDDEMYLSPAGEIGDFLNHSCEPNAYVKKKDDKLFLIAIKDIEKGEEITFDYSTILARDDSWTMKCRCKTKSCRKTIGGFAFLPKPLQKKYKKLGMVPDYILRN